MGVNMDKMKKYNELNLWIAFRKGDLEARNVLIEEYTPLVKYVAGRVKMIVPPQIEYDDLVSLGVLGLIQAVERYNPDQGYKFSTFATQRIRGAIFDGLRSQDWITRTAREKAKKLSQTLQSLEQRYQREPEEQEIAGELGLSLEEYHKFILEANIPELTSLDTLIDPDSNTQLIDQITDGLVPEEILVDKELQKLLAEVIERLNEQERLVIALYYYEELTQAEIALVLDLSPARVSQIHAKSILRLRGMLSRKKTLLF